MNSLKQNHEKLRVLLRQAYQERVKPEVGGLWIEGIMCRIRELGTTMPVPHFWEMFEPFIWRLAPFVCILILTLAVVLITFHLTIGYDPFQVFMNGKEEITLAQLFEL